MRQLPPKHNFNGSFNYDWDIQSKKREIEMLKPKEICPKRNHSFHTSTSECDKSFHNRSFEKSIQETEKVSSRMQSEFGQLKNLIQKKRNEIEKQQRQQDLKLQVSDKQFKEMLEPKKNKEETPQFNYYQTFKPIFAKINTLIESSNTKEQDKQRLVTLFDSLDQESIKKSKEPDQMLTLVQQLVKEFVIPTLEQQTPQKQIRTPVSQQQSSNNLKQQPSNQLLFPKSLEQSFIFKNIFDIPFRNPSNFYSQIKTNESGYYEFNLSNKTVINESINNFNISKEYSCKLVSQLSNLQIDFKLIKQSLIQQEVLSLDEQTQLIPFQLFQRRIVYILCSPLQFSKQIFQYIQMNTKNQALKLQFGFNKLNFFLKQQINKKQKKIIERLFSLNRQVKQLKIIIQKLGFNKIKQNFIQQKLQLQQYSLRIQKMYFLLREYQQRLKYNSFKQLVGNDDLIIMLQSLQSETSLEQYLQQIFSLLGDKLVVSILNFEILSVTSYLPEYGLIQEFFEDIDDISQFNTLYQLTLNVNTELMNNQHIEFENRHIWKVTDEIYLITSSNMSTHYLSKIALILTNGISTIRQKYLELFKFMRIRQEQYQLRIKIQFFNKWRKNKQQQDQLKNELINTKQEQEQQQRLIYQYEIELQNIQIQNALKSKCLSSAMLENTLSKRENELHLREIYFNFWKNKVRNQRHYEQRIKTGQFLLDQAIIKIEQIQLDKAFREIAFSYNQIQGTLQTSPILKNTKRSFHTREQTKRSQEELEQSVLWDVHQMKINTPNNNHKGQSLSPITSHTVNQSFFLENENLYQYHSQRCTQQQKKKVQCQSSQDQENVQTQNKIYSQRTKDFVRKISNQQPSHKRINSTQPGSSFSFYDLQH